MDLTEFKTCRYELKRPLLVITGSKGSLACGYLNVATFDKLEEAGAVVSGVSDFDDMAQAKIQQVSTAAEALGVKVGMTGAAALELFR
ncbi:MAG: hypothetical protein ACI9G1_001390 [Pirellulaceae bacterium]|jgi:uncharacterized protein YunC (DUF1805 family)